MDSHFITGENTVFIAEEYCSAMSEQKKYNCKYLNYWIDKKKDKVFFLIDAPDKDSIKKLHNLIDGLFPKEIFLVNGKISDALRSKNIADKTTNEIENSEIKIINYKGYRTFLVTNTTNSRLLQYQLGIHNAHKLLSLHDEVIFEQVQKFGGHEIESEEEGFVIFFTSSHQALECANSIQKELNTTSKLIDLRIGIHTGLPSSKNNVQNDDIIKIARYFCRMGKKKQIVISSIVRELYTDHNNHKIMDDPDRVRWLFKCEGEFLEQLMDTLINNWQNPKFGINDFCLQMSMSKSHLYRKCKTIIGVSLNSLLGDFRLLKSLEILNKTDSNISQTSFDTGFTNASYFSKCFKNKFGIQPTFFLKNFITT